MHIQSLKYLYYTTIMLLLFLSAFCFIFLYPFDVIHVTEVRNEMSTVKAGEHFFYALSYCKYIEGSVTVGRNLVDDVKNSEWELPEFENHTIPMGCHTINVAARIPLYIPAGIYHIKVTGIFHINQIRDVSAVFDTDSFEVIPSTLI